MDISDRVSPALQALYASLNSAGRRQLLRQVVQDLRRANARRIGSNIDPDGHRFTMRTPLTHKKGKMFPRIARARWLKTDYKSGDEGQVFFDGFVDRVAAVHQFGKKDKPFPNAPFEANYPMRPLLGINRSDEDAIIERISQFLLKGAKS